MPKHEITLLNECVAQEDGYKDCTHQKIADTLHDIIESDNNAITIGLEGEWGSGKSTVINLLEKKYNTKEGEKTIFFKFDAWSHDGDPLRITFLTSFINKIKKTLNDNFKSNAQKNDIENKLASLHTEVTGKVKRTQTKNTKSSTIFGKLLAISIILVPIGSILFSKTYDLGPKFIPIEILLDLILSERHFNYELYKQSFSLYPTISSLILFSPILLIFTWIFIGKILDPKHKKWEFISSQSEETIEQDIIEMGDKTSFEFERLFTQIVDTVVGDAKPFSKIVCVIDNMDRVGNEHAKNIWSTLQIFITNNHPKSNSMWFIIPFDESVFNKIWPSSQSDDDYISNSFTEKCFQLVIDVPTPITSNWIHYLTEISNNAFKQWSEPNLAELFVKQYKDYFSTVEHSPTPRSINNTINQVQALLIRFIDEKDITINAITIYSLLRRTKSKEEIKEMILYPLKSNINSSILSRVTMYHRELSSILFHVPYDRGFELLLNSEISKILNSNNEQEYERLVSLHDEHEDAFWQAWDYNYQLSDYKNTSENIQKSAIFLNVVANYLFKKKNTPSIERYIKRIGDSFHEDVEFLFKDHDYKKSHEYIKNLSRLSIINDNAIEKIKATISFSINEFIFKKEMKPSSTTNNQIDLASIKGMIDILEFDSIECKQIDSYNTFYIWCEQQELDNTDIPEILPNASSFKEIIRQTFSKDYLNTTIMTKLCNMAEYQPEWTGWDNAIEEICGWAERPNSKSHAFANQYSSVRSTDKDSLFFLLVQTLNSKSSKKIKDVISNLLSNERFTSGLFYEFRENINNESLAILIKPIVDSGKLPFNNEIATSIKEIYKKII